MSKIEINNVYKIFGPKPAEVTAEEGEAAATEEGATPAEGETKTEGKEQKPTEAKPDAKKEPAKK